jgi:histone-binding protein RBBP4
LVAATGQNLCLWDTNKASNKPQAKILDAHQNVINDVKFSILNHNIFGTASDDNNYKLWDYRNLKDSNSFIQCNKASDDYLLVISFNCFNEFLFATGGE